uniref:Uncharacterized protein n=1 Tax=Arundo donax TaxID=35708 RepID=A0A0A9BDB8_ARUDO
MAPRSRSRRSPSGAGYRGWSFNTEVLLFVLSVEWSETARASGMDGATTLHLAAAAGVANAVASTTTHLLRLCEVHVAGLKAIQGVVVSMDPMEATLLSTSFKYLPGIRPHA